MLLTPSTLDLQISPPRKRSRSGYRHGITDAQRRELRQYWVKAPADAKLTQKQIAAWLSAKFHPISQSTVSDFLKPIYDYLLRATWSPKRRSLIMIWTRLSQFGLPRLLLPYKLLRTGKSSRTTVPSRSSSSSRTLRSALGRCSC
jgi:hypothetical protein